MIHHLTSGSHDLNLGKAINDTVKHLPDNDWICVRDIDTMPAYHEKYYKLCHELIKSDYGLIGCMTNRIGLMWQLHGGAYSQDTNWLNHRKIGKDLFYKHKNKIIPLKGVESVAGMFMLFPKKVWLDVGGFIEGHIRHKGSFVDWWFSEAVKEKGYKLGIAQGLYLIHQYRPDHINPRCRTEHLEK